MIVAAGRKVRSFDDSHQFIDGYIRVVHQHDDAIDDFRQVVRRNTGGHADGDADSNR